ncbi:MAG: chemotaxis protein CheW [Planctomycetota bacterium]
MTSDSPNIEFTIDSNVLRVVTFRLGDEQYCLDIFKIQRIVPMGAITHVPRQPEFMEGVMNLRGDVIPIIDLRKRLGVEPKTNPKQQKIVIVIFSDHIVGFIVDEVNEHVRIPLEKVKPAGDVLTGRSAEFVRGLIEQEDGSLLMLLDPIKALDDGQQEALNKLLKRHGGTRPL